MSSKLSRRQLLAGAAAAAGLAAFASPLRRLLGTGSGVAQAAFEDPAVVAIFLPGGYNAVFSSADSYLNLATPNFSVSASGITNLGTLTSGTRDLYIDNATYGTLADVVKSNMAAVGVNHGISDHGTAERVDWLYSSSRLYPLMLAAAMPGTAAIRCATVGGAQPCGGRFQDSCPGPFQTEGGLSLQQIRDFDVTLRLLGVQPSDPSVPTRATAAAALQATRSMSAGALAENTVSLKSVGDSYDAVINTLNQQTTAIDFSTMASAYGLSGTISSVTNFASKMLAAEAMINLGCKVVCVVDEDGSWDSHDDVDGTRVRNYMTTRILPALKVFLERSMTLYPGRNITTGVFGDFARTYHGTSTTTGSNHASLLSATVFGKHVKRGTTGRVLIDPTKSDGRCESFPTGTPGAQGFWSLLAALSGIGDTSNPFGANPHSILVQP